MTAARPAADETEAADGEPRPGSILKSAEYTTVKRCTNFRNGNSDSNNSTITSYHGDGSDDDDDDDKGLQQCL